MVNGDILFGLIVSLTFSIVSLPVYTQTVLNLIIPPTSLIVSLQQFALHSDYKLIMNNEPLRNKVISYDCIDT